MDNDVDNAVRRGSVGQVVRFLVALVLLLSITPAVPELVESVVHLVTHADLPHHDELASEHERGCSEHTCTPLAHHCGCHATMFAQASRATEVVQTDELTQLDPSAIAAASGRACGPPPLRPPIA